MSVNYKQLFDKAYKLHSMGNFDEAEKLYNILIEMSPEDSNTLNLYGLLCIAKKDYQKAITYLSKAVVLSKSPIAVTNLGKAHLSNNEYEKAIRLFQQSLQISPNDDTYYSMAIAYKKMKNLEMSAQCYEKALELNPNNYNAGYNLVVAYKDLKRYKEAINYANKCILLNPKAEEIYSLLSFLYECVNDLKSAVKALEKAAMLDPKQYLYFYNLGVLYSKLHDSENSILNYKKVIALKPDSTAALVNLSLLYRKRNINLSLQYILLAQNNSPKAKNVLLNLAQIYKDMGRNSESIKTADEILNINPKSHEAYSILAMNYMDMCEYTTAYNYYEKALELSPDTPSYLHGKAVALKYLGKTAEFKELMNTVFKKDPNTPEVRITLGMSYLADKEFQKGMELYRARNLNTNFNRFFGNKCWKESDDISGKNVLLYSNCGLGDTLMYARYFNFVAEKAENVIVQTDDALIKILKNNYKNIEFISKKIQCNADYDIAVPIMDIPYMLNMDFSNIPSKEGYIKADDELVQKFSKLDIFNTEKKKIGLFLQGNRRIFKNRFIPQNSVLPFFENQNIQFYSLQISQDISFNENIINFKQYIKDYNDTAAILKNIDLLISIDSSIVHMAGALGVKTFLMLPYTPEWRWFNDCETSSWYNSVKIFKQSKIADWTDVFDRINTCLKKL